MKPFIVVDGVTYINESMINTFSNIIYEGNSRKEQNQLLPVLSLSLKGGWSLSVNEGKVEIKDSAGVLRVRAK